MRSTTSVLQSQRQEAAFSRAFKRVTGLSPGRWRDGAGDSPDLMPLQFKTPLGPVPDTGDAS